MTETQVPPLPSGGRDWMAEVDALRHELAELRQLVTALVDELRLRFPS